MKRRIWALLLIALLLSGCAAKETEKDYLRISAAEAAERMAAETDCVILDVRSPEEYASGHIPGAICIPNESIGADVISQLPDRDQLILVYCRSGNRSKQAARKLVDLGYSNIVEFGGINSWTGEIVTGNE